MSNKTYISGSAKKKTFANGGSILNCSICVEQLVELAKGLPKSKNGKTYIPFKISERREEDQYGNTHSLEVDDFNMNRLKEQDNEGSKPTGNSGSKSDDLPF